MAFVERVARFIDFGFSSATDFRERYCKANLRSLRAVSDWVEIYQEIWTKQLDALEVFLNKESKTQHLSSKKSKRK